MDKEIKATHIPYTEKRVHLDINKIHAALCIVLSAVTSITVIAWLLS